MFPASTYQARRQRLQIPCPIGDRSSCWGTRIAHATSRTIRIRSARIAASSTSLVSTSPGLRRSLIPTVGAEILFGDDPGQDDLVWTGPPTAIRRNRGARQGLQTRCHPGRSQGASGATGSSTLSLATVPNTACVCRLAPGLSRSRPRDRLPARLQVGRRDRADRDRPRGLPRRPHRRDAPDRSRSEGI